MQEKEAKARKQPKAKRRGGILRESPRNVKVITALVLTVACVTLAFTQLGFLGVGFNGEYSGYLVLELVPIAVAALLLGPLAGMCMGAFAGGMLLIHATQMPLNYYELTFVTPLTSIIMMGVTGLLLGLLFKFVLRNNPGPIKSAIYITIVCFFVSLLYSVGFVFNAIFAMALNFVVNTAGEGLSETQATRLLREQTSAFVLRMGNVNLQLLIDAVLMSLSCVVATVVVAKEKRSRASKGLRSTFALHLSIVVIVAFMVTSVFSFVSITQGELAEAESDMNDEIDYLQKQLSNMNKRTETLGKLLDAGGVKEVLAKEGNYINFEAYSVDSLLDGYEAADDGTILILSSLDAFDEEDLSEMNKQFGTELDSGYVIISSDDGRFPTYKTIKSIAGDEVDAAIEKSVKTGKVERVVYDEDYGKTLETLAEEGIDTVRSQIVYVLAREDDNYRVVVMFPTRKVFAARARIMVGAAVSAFVLLASVFVMVFLLLERVVARRIDETNGVLVRITGGDLNATVDVRDPREFASLSNGVNETVTALKGWIAEAESRIDTELATAKAIQESALPRIFPPYPDVNRFDVYASMKAAREIGGDFYDFFLIGDDCDADSGKLGFIIADVSGKGVPAALFMMKSMTQLRDYLMAEVEIGEAVENANRQLCKGNDEGMFVTVWAGVLDYATGHVDFVNAGHNPPLIWQKERGWHWLEEKSGLPLGLFEDFPYEAYSLECNIGDQFLLYTDGVTEAMSVDGELYGEGRLEALANANYTRHPRMLVDAVRHDVATWAKGAEQSDDITILSLEYGVPPEVTATLQLPAELENLPLVNEFIHSELDRRLCPKRVQNQLDIAVEELYVNVCHYAYPDATPEKPGTVRILRTYSADPPCVVVDIIDEGIPYNPLAKPDAVTPDDIADVPIGGLGILMAKKCTDEMRYERSGDNNIVTIVKKW